MDNLGGQDERITIFTSVISGGAMDAFSIIDFNANTWRESVAAQVERYENQQAENQVN